MVEETRNHKKFRAGNLTEGNGRMDNSGHCLLDCGAM